MTVKRYYERVLGLPFSMTADIDPILASIIGLGCDAISAWWGWHFELPGFRQADRYRDLTFHSFPGGNTGFARYFVKGLNPDALEGSTSLRDVLLSPVQFRALDREENEVNIRLNATVVRVEHEADKTVSVTYSKTASSTACGARTRSWLPEAGSTDASCATSQTHIEPPTKTSGIHPF